jgi:mannonate dehydratase
MRLALTMDPLQDSDLLFAQQLGVQQIMADIARWDAPSLAAARNRVEEAGLQLVGVESLPVEAYISAIKGEQGRDGEIAQVCEMLRRMGQAGVSLVGYRWALPGPAPLPVDGRARGGASGVLYPKGLPFSSAESEGGHERQWQNLAYFLRAVLPAAEEAGVRLAYQPTLTALAAPGLMRRGEDLERLFQLAPSSFHGLDMDHAWLALAGEDASAIIRRWGGRRRILAVQVRSLQATNGSYGEGFLDEDREGLFRALHAYRVAGFTGPLRPAPSPRMVGDTPWGHKGYAFSIGYLRAMLQAMG